LTKILFIGEVPFGGSSAISFNAVCDDAFKASDFKILVCHPYAYNSRQHALAFLDSIEQVAPAVFAKEETSARNSFFSASELPGKSRLYSSVRPSGTAFEMSAWRSSSAI
jgi:hypothetical protein